MKRSARNQAQIDWALFGARWLLYAAFAADIYVRSPDPLGGGNLLVWAALAVGVVVNVAEAFLLLASFWNLILSLGILLVDVALAVALFALGGWSGQYLLWAALLPVVAAAIRFGWLQSIAGTMIVMVSAALVRSVFLLNSPDQIPIQLLLLVAPGLVLSGAAVSTGLIAERIKQATIRRTHSERDMEERRTRHAREQTRAIYDLASLVTATLNYERVLDAALDRSAEVMADSGSSVQQMVSAALLFRNDELRVVTARRFTPNDMKVALPGQRGVLAEAINSGEPAYSTQPFRDPELSQVVALRSCRAFMAVPLRAGLDNFGVIAFAHPQPNFFDLNHIELLEAICKHTIIALQNAKLYQRLLDEKERIVEVEEEARKKLARDLHDGPTQAVAAIAMRANYIRRLLEREPQQAAEEVYKVEELARRTTKEIRHMLFTLRPLVLESQGLIPALQALADKMRENYNLNVIIEGQPEIAEKLDVHAQGVLFYVVEEAVGNARKHAEAEHIWVRLKLRMHDVVGLEIQDDGVGFDVSAVDASYDKRGSLGMVNMRERTELVNGSLSIESAPGKGTRITILVPLTEDAREKLGNR